MRGRTVALLAVPVFATVAAVSGLTARALAADGDRPRPPHDPGRWEQCATRENEETVEAAYEVCALLPTDCELECRARVERAFTANLLACLRGEREPGPWLVGGET